MESYTMLKHTPPTHNRKNKGNKQKTLTSMVNMNPNLSIITLEVRDLNLSIKKQRLSEWIKK